MKKHLSKKRVVLAAIVAVTLAIASGVAYAYWTSIGTGTGNAAVAAGDDVDIVVTDTGAALYPGGHATITFHIQNNSTTNSVRVDKVVQDGAVTGLPGGCLATDFSFADATVDQTIAASSDGTDVTGTLSMADTSLNQDSCKLANPVLHLKTDNSGI